MKIHQVARWGVSRHKCKQGSQVALCRAEIAHLISSHICCLFETFNETWNEMYYLKLFETWNFLKLETCQSITGVAYLKLSDETWNKMCYLKCLKYLKLFKHIMGVTYLKLSDDTWKKMWYLKPLELFEIAFVFWASFDNFDTHSIRINITTLIVYFELLSTHLTYIVLEITL